METENEYHLKKELVDISRRCGEQGWCPATVGNISVLNSNLKRIYIKRTGADLNRIKLQDILTLDLDGNILEGKGKPSIETSFHLGIYNVRRDVEAVIHVHPPFTTAHAVAKKKIPMLTEAAKIVLIDVLLLPRAPPGSIELATKVTEGFKDSKVKAVLLTMHGLVSIGKTLQDAYYTTALVENTAKIALLSSLIKS